MYNDFTRYLTAKRTVDDRALNRPVWERLAEAVRARQAGMSRPLRVLEIGAGIGTMVERLLAWRLFDADAPGVHYTLLDADPALLAAAQDRLTQLPSWLKLEIAPANVLEYATRVTAAGAAQQCDLLIANAVLDLLDLPTALPQLRGLVTDKGLFYFTINFDGATLLEPTIDPAFDDAVEAAYHRTMDARITDGRPSGDSRTGRHLFTRLPATGFDIRAAGSSDWVVHPIEGRYPADEAYFLHFIVATMERALRHAPTLAPARFAAWIATRHAQINDGELTYIAHQIDFFGVTH
ncbi:MAG TPA: class I SAM-dependent methyltransferase [Chloroflexi bacterium]|nr:class I SAM-dependent methyltransferase [Chloroflexota bacterium]HHW84744.1 methyltransferase [Chloroflexota bacterium]